MAGFSIKDLFVKEKKPHKGLYAFEWAMIIYAVATTVLLFFMHTRLHHPQTMLLLRVQFLMMTLIAWGFYRIMPCRAMTLFRAGIQLGMLGEWYPDTYDFNRVLPNFDHVVASWEQSVFGSQPALWLHEKLSSPVVSELLDLGYVSYYPLIVVALAYFYFWKPRDFGRAAFIVLGSFFVFYCIFIAFPVTGPQFYYKAVGLENIAAGVFPDVGTYFETHQECLPIPGWKDGFLYDQLVVAHYAGERPTAAFPSSHVGVTTVLLFLVRRDGPRRLFWTFVPFATLMFFATFYIQAHYVVDAVAGLFAGAVIYYALDFTGRRINA